MGLRLRVEYEKGKELKYLSHLQVMRMVERTLRRARIPYALSEGFNPHMKLSLGTVLPVGVWGTSEFFDIEMTERVAPADFVVRVNRCAPPGFRVKQAVEIPDKTLPLQAQVNAAAYRLSLDEACDLERVRSVIETALRARQLPVTGRGKTEKTKDLRPGIYEMGCRCSNGNTEILVKMGAGSAGNIRPDELVDCLAGLGLPCKVVDICRLGNYIKDGDTYSLPLGGGET